MKKIFLTLILCVSISACAGVEKKISADECGCPQDDQKTISFKKQQGISADECGCPQNNQKTILTKDQNLNMTAD